MKTLRLTMAQALVRYLLAQQVEMDGRAVPMFAGVFAIFGHGNVAGLGEALAGVRDRLPVLRPHNEQGMAHAAIAYAKALRRRRMFACTTSIGPGATNMVTAAALAHVNRLPVLLLPGETFAGRLPDPVLQQVEVFADPTVTANDCFRPVSRFWDRIMRPAQLLRSLPQALRVLTDPAECGPAVLCLPQDVQAEAWDYPEDFFAVRLHRSFRAGPDAAELHAAAELLRSARRPLLIAGGGVIYSAAESALAEFAAASDLPVAETQAGKGSLPWNHACNVGAIGVTGSSAANRLLREADLVIALGTRLGDFTTGSGALLARDGLRILAINACAADAIKYRAQPLRADLRRALEELAPLLGGWRVDPAWRELRDAECRDWHAAVDRAMAPAAGVPTDAQVIGAVMGSLRRPATVVCAAGGLPGELHKLWRASADCGYHLEYGYSCMGYEIAGGLGVKLACPEREVIVMVGDGSYLMLNSEIATAVALGLRLIIVLLDNRGFGCINRLQQSCGSPSFNNLLDDGSQPAPAIDFVAHAAALGARSERVDSLEQLGAALERAYAAALTSVIVIQTDPAASTGAGGAWWDVPVPEVSASPEVRAAYQRYRTESAKRG